ncbi:MAG TPA: FkbM family methyltransferase [Bryobacteraceae bacterium]|nr:FkbM family methyltransferase [Bryobacteraceae bacterium]
MEEEGIYFFHIPKTAGVSVWRFLEHAFPSEQICPWWMWDQLITVPVDELSKWKVYRGHFQCHLEPYLSRPLRTFTLLRDPVRRTVSWYCHIRRAPEHPFHDHALRMSLAEFCVHPETRHLVENYQATWLAKSPSDPTIAAQGISADDLARFELQRRIEFPDKISDSAELFERARARLAEFTAVGAADHFSSSILDISMALQCAAPPPFEPQNANPEGLTASHVDAATLEVIRDLTRVDQRLYESVVSHAKRTKLHWINGPNGSAEPPMISYAQNFEDVMLRRVFRDRTDGFYVDVGAMDPVTESVTKFFYDQGWSGINIEPNEWFYNKLMQERPRDINLNLAVGDHEESRPLYVFEQYGISTFEESNRDRFIQHGYEAEEKTVKITTLAAICREHVHCPIDFLKVDCEGWEKLALDGADWERFRPVVVIVEATEPGTTIPSWQQWEPLIESARYDMVYFDGLNRFYLRRESEYLRYHFEAPPNVFDEFTLYATAKAEQTAQTLGQERDTLAAQVAALEGKLNQATAENLQLQEKTRLEAEEIGRLGNELQSSQTRVAELDQKLLKTRLWVGQLSQELAASKRR